MNYLRALTLLFAVFALPNVYGGDSASNPAVEMEPSYSDVAGVMLAVETEAPDFTLTSIAGTKVSLSDFRGGNVVLIFYRGSWCPFCVSHLEDINTVLPKLKKIGVQVIAISPDNIADIRSMANRMDNPYVFLSDPDLAVIERYGIRRDVKLPHPAMVVIDQQGVVQWFYVSENFKKRPSASQLMRVINRIK